MIGGTGLVGRETTRRFWASGDVDLVSFVRGEPRARYERRLEFERLLHEGGAALGIDAADVAVSCVGTTMKKAQSKGGFRRVDYDYVLAFAKAARRFGARQFILVSSVGASRAKSSYYLAVKAEIEGAIARLGYERFDIIRPGLLLGNRREPRLGERIAMALMPLVSPFLRGRLSALRATRADTVARAIVALAGAPGHGRFVHHNRELEPFS